MSAGGTSSSGDSRFSREGTVNTNSWRELTTSQDNQFQQSLASLSPKDSAMNVDPLLSQQMTREWGDVPYSDAICKLIGANMPGVPVPGQASLTSQSNVDPYSQEYANNTYGRYANEVERLMATAKSGPQMTRGGTAAQGFAMSDAMNQASLNREDVLSQHRQADASISQGAANQLAQARQNQHATALSGVNTGWGGYYNLLNNQNQSAQITNDRSRSYNDLLTGYTGLSSVMKGNEINNLSGRGAQSSSSMGASMNLCCFIFLESYNGKLPITVRKYRDEFAPENTERRKGYIRMSKWLVPAMRMSKLARKLTNFFMVKPLTHYANWYYGINPVGWVFAPVKSFWFTIWNLTGK